MGADGGGRAAAVPAATGDVRRIRRRLRRPRPRDARTGRSSGGPARFADRSGCADRERDRHLGLAARPRDHSAHRRDVRRTPGRRHVDARPAGPKRTGDASVHLGRREIARPAADRGGGAVLPRHRRPDDHRGDDPAGRLLRSQSRLRHPSRDGGAGLLEYGAATEPPAGEEAMRAQSDPESPGSGDLAGPDHTYSRPGRS